MVDSTAEAVEDIMEVVDVATTAEGTTMVAITEDDLASMFTLEVVNTSFCLLKQ